MTSEAFYDCLAGRHRLFYADWKSEVRREGEWLEGLLRPSGARTVLDCTCGIGTQAIALALHGYAVSATDLSEQNIAEARRGAAEFGASVSWEQADVRRMEQVPRSSFDVVLSLGNSLSHLLTPEDLLAALGQIRDRARPGGIVLVGQRDWDHIRKERPPFVFRHDHRDQPAAGQRTILFDLWHYDDPLVTFEVFWLTESTAGWRTDVQRVDYRMWSNDELQLLMAQAGLTEIRRVEHRWEVRYVGRRGTGEPAERRDG